MALLKRLSGFAFLALFTVLQLLVYAGMQVPVGVALDRYGSRRLLMTGLVLMTAGQLAFAFVTGVEGRLPSALHAAQISAVVIEARARGRVVVRRGSSPARGVPERAQEIDGPVEAVDLEVVVERHGDELRDLRDGESSWRAGGSSEGLAARPE